MDTFSPDMVPFDTYSASLVAFVIERATNNSVPIVTFAACEGSDKVFISSVGTSMISTRNYDPWTGLTTADVYSSLTKITAIRSQLAQAFTICLLLIDWALALGSAYVTFIVVVAKENVHEGVLLLPITIVLTIPTLRDLYVDSPPFGIYLGRSWVLRFWFRADAALRYIWVLLADNDSCMLSPQVLVQGLTQISDTFGFFLQMMIVAICSMILLYVIATPSVQDRRVLCDNGNPQLLGQRVAGDA